MWRNKNLKNKHSFDQSGLESSEKVKKSRKYMGINRKMKAEDKIG